MKSSIQVFVGVSLSDYIMEYTEVFHGHCVTRMKNFDYIEGV